MITSRKPEPMACPSAQPDMQDAQLIGVVTPDETDKDQGPRVAYLKEAVAVTPDVLEMAGPLPPAQVFRFSARCEESKCSHFDGTNCTLAKRVADMLPAVVDALPPCIIRKTCRWHAQEGAAACLRCPQVVTHVADPDDHLNVVAGTGQDNARQSGGARESATSQP